jgi:hypothetical protein
VVLVTSIASPSIEFLFLSEKAWIVRAFSSARLNSDFCALFLILMVVISISNL